MTGLYGTVRCGTDMPNAQRLLARLSASLGKQTATQELRWMCEAVAKSSGADTGSDAKAGTDLEQMIARRLRGEPLQYILGESGAGPVIRHYSSSSSLTPLMTMNNSKQARSLSVRLNCACAHLSLSHVLRQNTGPCGYTSSCVMREPTSPDAAPPADILTGCSTSVQVLVAYLYYYVALRSQVVCMRLVWTFLPMRSH